MIALKIFCILSLVNFYEINCNNTENFSDEISDYYWREYTGIIPGDAIPGGIDTSGSPTYIGQMCIKNFGLIPATIRTGNITALATIGGSTYTADKFVKILCSRNQNKYKWIVTKNEETHLLTTCHLVIGGTAGAAGYVIHLGRVRYELETVIGNVFPHHSPYPGLFIPNGNMKAPYQSYEILTYDCKDITNPLEVDNLATNVCNTTITIP